MIDYHRREGTGPADTNRSAQMNTAASPELSESALEMHREQIRNNAGQIFERIRRAMGTENLKTNKFNSGTWYRVGSDPKGGKFIDVRFQATRQHEGLPTRKDVSLFEIKQRDLQNLSTAKLGDNVGQERFLVINTDTSEITLTETPLTATELVSTEANVDRDRDPRHSVVYKVGRTVAESHEPQKVADQTRGWSAEFANASHVGIA